MDSKIWLIMVAVALAMGSVQAADMTFYSDGTIEEGDIYDVVSVYDTSPNQTTVNMFGGSIITLETYDSSRANVCGGEIIGSIITGNSSRVDIYWGNVSLDFLAVGGTSTLNIYGGDLLVGNSPGFSDSSTVNLYGYGFTYDGFELAGCLSDGSPFFMYELFPSDYANMNLIQVHEPLTAEVRINPKTLNLASKGKWVTCHIWLPEDCNVAEIDPETVLLERRVKADWAWFDEEQQVAMFRFSRSEVAEILESGEVELTVTGHLVDGTYFEGTDTIKIIDKGRRKD
jgi:hypothetical protein